MSKSNFIVRGGADFSQIKQEMDKTQKQFKGFQSTLSTGLSTIGKLTGITLGTAALVNFGKQAIKVSSDIEEIQNVTDTVFGSMAKDIDNFSKGLIESHGMGELTAKKYASYLGAMMKSSGIQGDAVRQMSKDLALLTADMASFYNLESDEMFQKMMSAMSGMPMPMKQLGINMNIANLEAFALSQGIKKSWQEMSQAEQVMIRYQYLMAATGDAQGDFARNNWNWAHSVKILGEKWQEFMGIVGKGLQVVILPLVKGLIKVLDLLIKIAKSIGEIYTMITGKEVSVDTKSNTSMPDEKEMGPMLDIPKINKDIGKTGGKAAKGEKDLGKGIDKAAKAAKKALAPFDELNILQKNLVDNINGGKSPGGSGSGGGKGPGGLGGFDDGINNMVGNMENTMKTKKTADDMKSIFDDFFTWFMNKWKKLKQTLEIPIKVPAPIFAELPNPVYNPDWGLVPPLVPVPVFPPIPAPVYNPDWGLDPPPIPQLVFPPLLHEEYDLSLETVKALTSGAYENIKVKTGELKTNVATQWQQMNERVKSETATMQQRLATTWGVIGANYQTHRQNMGVISAGIATVMAANAARGVTTSGRNQNAGLSAMQRSMLSFGRNIGIVAAGASMALARNLGSGLNAGIRNFNSFFRSTRPAMQSWASGLLRMSADWGRSFVSNIASALSTAWSNIRSFASSTGGKLKGWFSENKGTVAKTAIVAGAVVAAGTIALTFPASIPFVAGGLASIPALAKGGITNGEMLALVGDNPGGREVVSPLDDLMDMIQVAVSESGSNGSGDVYLTVKIGEDTLAEKVASEINRKSRSSGESIIEI
nr:MAG TPA: minor tail protein [Caudoviricetes sp.]